MNMWTVISQKSGSSYDTTPQVSGGSCDTPSKESHVRRVGDTTFLSIAGLGRAPHMEVSQIPPQFPIKVPRSCSQPRILWSEVSLGSFETYLVCREWGMPRRSRQASQIYVLEVPQRRSLYGYMEVHDA